MTLEEAIKLINDRVNSKKKTKFLTINEPYVYPILPGTKEWESFKSKSEMMDACQIPSEIVVAMSTKALTLSVINHPLLDTEVLFMMIIHKALILLYLILMQQKYY